MKCGLGLAVVIAVVLLTGVCHAGLGKPLPSVDQSAQGTALERMPDAMIGPVGGDIQGFWTVFVIAAVIVLVVYIVAAVLIIDALVGPAFEPDEEYEGGEED